MLLMSPGKAFDLEVRLAPVRQQAGHAAGLEAQSWQDPTSLPWPDSLLEGPGPLPGPLHPLKTRQSDKTVSTSCPAASTSLPGTEWGLRFVGSKGNESPLATHCHLVLLGAMGVGGSSEGLHIEVAAASLPCPLAPRTVSVDLGCVL